MRSKQRFGKADAAGISVVQVQVWFEKFPDLGSCVFQAERIEILRCALQGRSALRRSNVRRAFGIGSGRALTNGGAKVAAVAHQEKRGHRFERMQQAEHSALPFAHGERKRFEQWAFQRDPVSGRVHFVFREFKLPIAEDRKSTRLNSSHMSISYAVFCLKKKRYKNKNLPMYLSS